MATLALIALVAMARHAAASSADFLRGAATDAAAAAAAHATAVQSGFELQGSSSRRLLDPCPPTCDGTQVGLFPTNQCTEFFSCTAGSTTPTQSQPCPADLLFDVDLQQCEFDVNCADCVCCDGIRDDIRAYDGCRQFFHCERGSTTPSVLLSCPDGLLFSNALQRCENDVVCGSEPCTLP